MPANALQLEERVKIRVGIAEGANNTEIGKSIGRDGGTVGREIKRNGGRLKYFPTLAQKRADKKRSRPKTPKLVADKKLARYVARRLKLKDSPMTISIELARGTNGRFGSISHECIYQAIYHLSGLPEGIHLRLHLKHRRRKHRGRTKPNSHSLGQFNPIKNRPKIADLRTEFGHLEGDLIVGAYNRSAIITLFDRCSRYLWLSRVAAKTADATFAAMIRTLKRIPQHMCHTVTWDQGAEIARHLELAQRCGIDIYIADPKAPWQRPTNENGNALIRRFVGKGTDLSLYTTRQLRVIETRINTIPRRILGWATAQDIYNAHIAMTS